MKIGNRERIVLGVIGAVLAIGGLHMVAYKDSALQFKAAKDDFNSAAAEYASGGSPRSWADINKFDYETINKELEYWQLVKNSGMYGLFKFKDAFRIAGNDFTLLLEMYRDYNTDTLDELEKLRGSLQNTKLTFMDEYEDDRIVQGLNRATAAAYAGDARLANFNTRWAILKELPTSLTAGGADAGDLLRKLNDTNALIESSPAGSALLYQKQQEYAAQLAVFGLPLARRDDMKEKLGEWPAYFMTLNRVALIRKAVPRQELGILTEDDYTKQLRKLFRLDWGEADGFFAYRQGQALLDLIKLADANKVREVTEVKFWKKSDLKWPPKEEREKEAAAAGAAQPVQQVFDDSMMFDESMMFMGGDALGKGGGGMMAAASAKAEEEAKFVIGAAQPLEMEVVGSNASVMSFIYAATNSAKLYEVDSVRIQSVPGDEDLVKARVVVKLTVELKANNGALWEDDIDAKIAELTRQKNRAAQQEGASELAAAEGFVPDPANAAEKPLYDTAAAAPPMDPSMMEGM